MNLFTNFLLTTGILVTLIIIVILVKRQKKELHRKLLSLIFLVFLFVIIYSYAEINSIHFLFASTFVAADSVGFLLGPLLYVYVQSIFKSKTQIFPKAYWSFMPALGYIVLVSIPFLISVLNDSYLFSYLQFIDKNEYLLQFQAIYLLVYVVLCLVQVRRFRSRIKQYFSNLSEKDLNWIVFLLYGVLLVIGLHILIEIYSIVINGKVSINSIFTTISLIAMISYLGYYGLSQAQILLPEFDTKKSNDNSAGTKHHLSNASFEEIEQLKEKLIQLLETKKPFLDENLSLKTLAEMIPTTDRKLSALLNYYLNTNFYDFINSYRVEEVKLKMAHREFEKYTILAIALDAGFNSKSSFNRIFKKETGLSPSAYKNQLQNKE